MLKLPVWTSAAHACLGQGFFLVIVFITLALSPGWRRPEPLQEDPDRRLPFVATLTTVLIFGQLILGAVMRHMSAGLVIPDFPLAF